MVTDHSALKWLMNITDPTARLARWSIYLQAYEFKIVHRKGTTNGNADALSRPVLLCDFKEKLYFGEDISPKCLDPYDDENLWHYLINGKMQNGLSRKQVNRIKRSSKNLNYDPKSKSIFIHDKENELIEIPEPKQRDKIVKEAHEFGHFQVESTLGRVKESFCWKKMAEDVKRVVSSCIVCKENQLVPKINHPARTLKITGIFDRIGIDLVLGLPETAEGYKGLFVIVEYFILMLSQS